jgi:hypothetical protein
MITAVAEFAVAGAMTDGASNTAQMNPNTADDLFTWQVPLRS